MFSNREHAGKLLASRLKQLHAESPSGTVVVGLPRGGVPVGAEIALALGCPLDILVSKKIQAPDNPELAIGAVSSGGTVILAQQVQRSPNSARYTDAQKWQRERLVIETKEAEDRFIRQSGMKARPSIEGKRVILVDDGIATGMTTMAAMKDLRARKAGEIVLASPVVPYDTFQRLKQECDLVIALLIPYAFTAVGKHYVDFHQVSDEEVLSAMRRVAMVLSHES